MSGFFGTSAGYNSDLSLIASLFFFIIGLVAFFQARNRKFTPHANLMVWGSAAELDPGPAGDGANRDEDRPIRPQADHRRLCHDAPHPRGDRHGRPARDDLHRDPDEMGAQAPAPPHKGTDARGDGPLGADYSRRDWAVYRSVC